MSLKLKTPLVNIQPSTSFQQELVQGSRTMVAKYGNIFRAAATAVSLQVQIFYAIAFVESRGEHKLTSGELNGSDENIGIMQMNADGVYYALRNELPKKRISPAVVAMFAKYGIGLIPGSNLQNQLQPQLRSQLNNGLKQVEFNIWASAVYFRFMIEKTADADGTIRLDKVVVSYNVGEFSAPTKTNEYKSGDTLALLNKLPQVLTAQKNLITGSYILKTVGKNGGLDYFIRNNIS